ncbi:MAG: Crp/Fnr family transcriptional regulator [Chlorobi bacterium]|nr:Crp/Fnr family transcriptional regulator [Chlorobiota bacterium]
MSAKKGDKNVPGIHKSIQLFPQLQPEDQVFLNDKKTQLTYLKGENLFKQGAFSPYVMYIIDGLVRVYLQTGHDRQINIRLARAGDFLAFSSIFGENVYNYSAIAVKDSRVCMIDKEGLKHLLLKNPEFALQITSRNSQNERHLFDLIKNISYKQMRGKLASALLYLSTEEFLKEEVFLYLTRQDIADFASVSIESAIKFLKEFEKEGILKLSGRNIEIIDGEKLEEIGRKG